MRDDSLIKLYNYPCIYYLNLGIFNIQCSILKCFPVAIDLRFLTTSCPYFFPNPIIEDRCACTLIVEDIDC